MLDTKPFLLSTDFPPIYREQIKTLQVNLGYLCNLSCTHCHVNAGPKRTELMNTQTVHSVKKLLRHGGVETLDLTGGAPEMNTEFKDLVAFARDLGVEVIDRCNLTILEEPGYENLADFLATHKVTIVASLPCYSEKNVKQQRGNGVFESSIRMLKRLNSLGYASSTELNLHLVYNPNGHFLPPSQSVLEQDYKRILKQEFNISFNQLFTITNMPIQRFGGMLLSKGIYHEYMDLLKTNFNQVNMDVLMCKTTLSVDWQGFIYDCDFNQMLDMPLVMPEENLIASNRRLNINDLSIDDLEGFNDLPIQIGEHCYGCAAGQGSSCGGAL